MTVSHGMDPERARFIGEQLHRLGSRTADLHANGTAMIRVLSDTWAGPDLDAFLGDWEQAGTGIHEAADALTAAGDRIIDDAAQQETTSDGRKGPIPPDGETPHPAPEKSWWEKLKDAGNDLLSKGQDLLDGVGDMFDKGLDWLDEGLDWLNEKWKQLANTDFVSTIIDLIDDIGEWINNLPTWAKWVIGGVIAVVAIAAIVFFGAPVLATLAIAATIISVVFALREIVAFLRDPKGYLTDWWENSSTFEKIVAIGSIVLAPFGGRILGPILRKLDGPAEKAAEWVRRKLGIDPKGLDPSAPPPLPPRRHDYTDEDGNPVTSRYADDQVDGASANHRLDDTLKRHGMTRQEFNDALHEPVPKDPADLSEDQRKLMRIRDEMGAPRAGEPSQKVLSPSDYGRYIGNAEGSDAAQGSVTRLEDGVEMSTPRELHDGLRLDYDNSPFAPDDDSVKVLRFSSDNDAEISRYSSMGGKSATDDYTDPYTGNGFTKSTDPVVPESKLGRGSPLQDGAEIWTVKKDGSQTLDAVYDADQRTWVRVS